MESKQVVDVVKDSGGKMEAKEDGRRTKGAKRGGDRKNERVR